MASLPRLTYTFIFTNINPYVLLMFRLCNHGMVGD